LLYRGTRDGFDGEIFHTKCDGVENTLTIIKSEHDNIFGGFTEKAWESSNEERYADPKSFIFSLVNKENKPFIAMDTNDACAIECDPSCGPIFGINDIYIDFVQNCADFGFSYKHPDYEYNSEKARSILAGSKEFQTVEIEVFVATN